MLLLKRKLPYVFRFETDIVGKKKNKQPKYAKDSVGHADQRAATVHLPKDAMSLCDILKAMVGVLPKGAWQATVFPGRVIFYKEAVKYEHATLVMR